MSSAAVVLFTYNCNAFAYAHIFCVHSNKSSVLHHPSPLNRLSHRISRQRCIATRRVSMYTAG